jgi:hypothetical protein
MTWAAMANGTWHMRARAAMPCPSRVLRPGARGPTAPHGGGAAGAQVKKALPLEERADPYFDSYLGRKACAGAPEVALGAKSRLEFWMPPSLCFVRGVTARMKYEGRRNGLSACA